MKMKIAQRLLEIKENNLPEHQMLITYYKSSFETIKKIVENSLKIEDCNLDIKAMIYSFNETDFYNRLNSN